MANNSAQPSDLFNPDIPKEKTPDFTAASKGSRPDTSMGTLLEGTGKLFGDLVQAKDQWYKNAITEQATAGVDQISNEFGVGSAETIDRTIVPKDRQPLPEEIENSMAHLKNLKTASASGSLTYSNYLARLESVSRQLRSRYPGYREHIDSEMSQLTGVKSANALVRELFNESNKGNSAEKREEAFINSHIKDIPPQYWIDRKQGAKWEFDRLRSEVNIRVYNDANQNIRQNQIATENQEGTLGKTRAADAARTDLAQQAAMAERDISNGIGKTRKEFLEKTRAWEASGGKLDPEAEQQMRIVVTQYKMMRGTQLQDFLNNKRLGGDPKNPTYSEILSPQDKASIVENYNKETAAFIDALGPNPKIGILESKQAYNESLLTDERARHLSKEYGRYMAVNRELYGTDAVNVHLKEPEALQAWNKYLKDMGTLAILSGSKTIPDAKAAIKNAQAQGVNDAQFARSTLATLISTATNEKLPLAMREKAINGLYGPSMQGFINSGGDPDSQDPNKKPLTYADRQAYWNMMTNPQITQAIWKMKEQGSPEVWNNYKVWSVDTAYNLFRQDMQTLGKAELRSGNVDVRYDPDTHMFSVVNMKDGRPVAAGDFSGRFVARNPGEVNADEAKDNLNAALSKLIPVWKQEGSDPNVNILQMLSHAGATMAAEKRTPVQGTVAGALFKAFRDGVKDLFELTDEQKRAQAEKRPAKR